MMTAKDQDKLDSDKFNNMAEELLAAWCNVPVEMLPEHNNPGPHTMESWVRVAKVAYNKGIADERERCELTVLRERDSIGGRQDVRVKAACNRIATDIRNGGER